METNTEKKPRGGARPGAGRKTVPDDQKSVTKTVNLYPDEWEALEAHADRIGARSVGVFAAQILRQYLHQNAMKLDRFHN